VNKALTMKNRRITASILLFGYETIAGQSSLKVKKTTAFATSPTSGKEMYAQYCATCHGKDGKGRGARSGRTQGHTCGFDDADRPQQRDLSRSARVSNHRGI
jgi:mono/diheme cytochrome c family protein